MLSQDFPRKAGLIERKEKNAGGNGHGCGHNLLGAGAFAAALGIKAYLEQNDVSGTVTPLRMPGRRRWCCKSIYGS